MANKSPLDVGFVNVQPPLSVDEIVDAVRDGREGNRSGLDVEGVKTNITLEEIVQIVREGRERG